jgi:hypothetical protein
MLNLMRKTAKDGQVTPILFAANIKALHCAASACQLEVCEILLKAGASPTVENEGKNLPLHLFCGRSPTPDKKISKTVIDETKYAQVVTLMVIKGTDINYQNIKVYLS